MLRTGTRSAQVSDTPQWGAPRPGAAGPLQAPHPPDQGSPVAARMHPVFTQMCTQRNVCTRDVHREFIPTAS